MSSVLAFLSYLCDLSDSSKCLLCFYNFTCCLDTNGAPAFQTQALAAARILLMSLMFAAEAVSHGTEAASSSKLSKSHHAPLQDFILNGKSVGLKSGQPSSSSSRELPLFLVSSKYKSNELANLKEHISYFRKSESL